MEEERIKSALELAMERVAGLPELTPEEIAEQKEKEYRPVGETLGNKYLQGVIDGREMASELSQYRGEPARIVGKSLVSCLRSSIRLDD